MVEISLTHNGLTKPYIINRAVQSDTIPTTPNILLILKSNKI